MTEAQTPPKRGRGRPKGSPNKKKVPKSFLTKERDYSSSKNIPEWTKLTHEHAQNLLKCLYDEAYNIEVKFLQQEIRNPQFTVDLALLIFELRNAIERAEGTYEVPGPRRQHRNKLKGMKE